MVFAGHHEFAAEAGDRLGDARIVGRDDDAMDGFCLMRRLDDVLDQGLTRFG